MQLPSDQLDRVYDVLVPIPLIGAQPGDELAFRQDDDDDGPSVTLRRRLAPEFIAAIPERAFAESDFYEIRLPTPSAHLRAALIATGCAPDSNVPVDNDADEAPPPALRRVP